MSPKNHVLDGVQIPPWKGAIFGERGGALCSEYSVVCRSVCHSSPIKHAKTVQPIEMPFG